jgi:SH3-like domain-containing protein
MDHYKHTVIEQYKSRFASIVCTAMALALIACNTHTAPVLESTSFYTTTPRWTATVEPTPTVTFTPTPTQTPEPTPLPTPMALVVSVKMDGKINLLAEPSTKSIAVGELPPGVIVPIVDMSDDGLWLKIGVQPSGWVVASLVTLNGDVLLNHDTASNRQPLVQSDSAVNIREGPGNNYKAIGLLKPGQVAPVIDQDAKAAWLQIRTVEIEGWIAAHTVIAAGILVSTTAQVTQTVTP